MMRLIIILYVLIFLMSCGNEKKKDAFLSQRLVEVTKDYKNRMEPFRLSVNLTNHYPERIYNLPIKIESNLNSEKDKYYSDFIVSTFSVNKNIIDSIEMNLKNVLKLQSKTANDSTLTVISKERKLCSNMIPYFVSSSSFNNPEEVALWDDVYSHETISGLNKDFNIYLIDSGNLNVNEADKAKKNNLGIKENCFSKGIAINKVNNIVFYWIILW